MEILEVVNAHLGTCFSMDSTWQVSECQNHLEITTFFFLYTFNFLIFRITKATHITGCFQGRSCFP